MHSLYLTSMGRIQKIVRPTMSSLSPTKNKWIFEIPKICPYSCFAHRVLRP